MLNEKKKLKKYSLSKSGLNIISKYPKKIKKVAFCTPIGVGRYMDRGCNNITTFFFNPSLRNQSCSSNLDLLCI